MMGFEIMALIKCPECKKENVSDTAISCPECGYGIKEHFEKLKAEELRIQEEIEKKKREIDRIKSIPEPTKPKVSISGVIISVVLIIFSFLAANMDSSPAAFIMFFMAMGVICYVAHIHNLDVDRYNLAQNDFEAYQKEIFREQAKAEAEEKARSIAYSKEMCNKTKCIYCSSINTSKINSSAKVVNTVMFGVYGQKRYHQWHCNSCNSDF